MADRSILRMVWGLKQPPPPICFDILINTVPESSSEFYSTLNSSHLRLPDRRNMSGGKHPPVLRADKA